MKERLQQRVNELDPLPELLRTNELKLQDSQDRIGLLEKRNSELTRAIHELTTKVHLPLLSVFHVHPPFIIFYYSNFHYRSFYNFFTPSTILQVHSRFYLPRFYLALAFM